MNLTSFINLAIREHDGFSSRTVALLEPVKEFMADMFGDPDIKEEHNNMLQYQLKSNIKLSYIFGQLEAVRTHNTKLIEYSV
jgi:hypothetical protein